MVWDFEWVRKNGNTRKTLIRRSFFKKNYNSKTIKIMEPKTNENKDSEFRDIVEAALNKKIEQSELSAETREKLEKAYAMLDLLAEKYNALLEAKDNGIPTEVWAQGELNNMKRKDENGNIVELTNEEKGILKAAVGTFLEKRVNEEIVSDEQKQGE